MSEELNRHSNDDKCRACVSVYLKKRPLSEGDLSKFNLDFKKRLKGAGFNGL